MQKTGIFILSAVAAVLVIGSIVFSQLSYKICFRCDADGFYNRGLEYACSDKQSHRQTGLEFIQKAAEQKLLKAELTLAELYSSDLPVGYAFSNTEQRQCYLQDVAQDQVTGLSYFETVMTDMDEGQEVAPVVLDNLALLYLEGVLSADEHVDKASMLYEKAAAEGSFPAMLQLGILSNDRGDYHKAMQWLVQASENPKDVVSSLMIGDYYMYAKGVTKDYPQAKEWYRKALTRAEKQENNESEKLTSLKDTIIARLEMVNRKLTEENGSKQRVVINYRLEGGVKHFIIFAGNHPDQPLGEVINNDGNIYAVMNENLELTRELPVSIQENFSSMNAGMQWVLTTFAINSVDNGDEVVFDFVLTGS